MPRHFANVQALRGLACLLVVLYHVSDVEAGFGLKFNPLRAFQRFGFAGVDLFFVLSGFVIATVTTHRRGLTAVPEYLSRRAWRVYPPFWAALALAAGHHAVSHVPVDTWYGPDGLLEQALLFPTSDGRAPGTVPVAWTLSFEVLFYAAFALFMAVPRPAAAVLMVGWAVVVGVADTPTNRFAALAVSPYVWEFLLGVLAASLPGRLRSAGFLGVTALAAAWVAAGLYATYHTNPAVLAVSPWPRVAVFGPPAALLVWAAVAREAAGGAVRSRPLLALGNASYAVYLVHIPAILVVVQAGHIVSWPHSRLGHAAWIAAVVGGALAAGFAFHFGIEKPLLKLGKRVPAPAWPRLPAVIAARLPRFR